MVPLIGSMRDFHSLVIAPCRAHKAKSPGLRRGKTPIGNSRSTYKTHRTELSKKDQAILSPTVIGEGGADYQLVLTYNWNCYFGCFISGDYFYKAGRSTGSGSKTSIWIAPLTVGLQASIKIWESGNNVLQPYFLLGPRWYFVGAKNNVGELLFEVEHAPVKGRQTPGE